MGLDGWLTESPGTDPSPDAAWWPGPPLVRKATIVFDLPCVCPEPVLANHRIRNWLEYEDSN